MKKLYFTFCIVLLLSSAGCSNADEQTPPTSSFSDLERKQVSTSALSVSDLKAILDEIDLSNASLIYYDETEVSYPANAAIRAESYIEQLKSLVWEEYTPPLEWDGNKGTHYQLANQELSISSLLYGYENSKPIHLLSDEGEAWFVLPLIKNEQERAAMQSSLTLYRIFDSWHKEAEFASLYVGSGTALSIEELDDFQEYTESKSKTGNVVSATEISCFFTSLYSDPRDMDANAFLRYCPDQGVLEAGDEKEWQLVQKKRDWRLGEDRHLASLEEMPVPVHRLPRTYINEILTKYAGITLEEMHTDWTDEALFIPETDSFYTFTSDFGPGTFIPYYGEKNGDFVTLWGESSDYDAPDNILTLQKTGESWHILSHLPVED